MSVSRISLDGFRGATRATEVSFPPGRPLVLIFGENGTGKSTLADAFEFVCNGTYGSLDGYSLGRQAKAFVPSVGVPAARTVVTLETPRGKWVARLGAKGPITTPSAGCPDARILRRKSILRLIEAQPRERFETLRSFISVPNIESSEAGLREAAKQAENELESSVRSLAQATAELEKLWVAEGRPGAGAAESWARGELQKDTSALQKESADLAELETAIARLEEALQALSQARAESAAAASGLAALQERVRSAEEAHAGQGADTLKLVQDARQLVALRSPAECPVCEQPVIPGALVARLDERIALMKALIEAAEELRTLVQACQAAERNAHGKEAILARSRELLAEATSSTLGLVRRNDGLLRTPAARALLDETFPGDDPEGLAGRILASLEAGRPALRRMIEKRQRSISLRNALEGHLQTIDESQRQAQLSEQLLRRLRLVLEIVSSERKVYVDGVLAQVSDEVETLYAALHPDESLGQTRFHLKPNAIGSLEFDAAFQDVTGVPPQAYYSESHLDTLGICVFLALAKLYRSEDTILILDDVLTSVDGPHLQRFLSLLRQEAKHFANVLVTTHYEHWRDSWAEGPSDDSAVIDLGVRCYEKRSAAATIALSDRLTAKGEKPNGTDGAPTEEYRD